MNRFLPFLILIFLVGLIGVSTYKLNEKQNIKTEEFGVHFVKSEIVLPDFSLPNLFSDGEEFSKKDLRGKKYVLVNFFASWCTTCHAEHEILMRLKQAGTVDIYGVAWHDIANNTRDYLRQHGNPFKKVANDTKGLLSKETGIQAIPETWIVKDGIILWRYRGNLQDFSVEEIQSIVLE